MGLLDRAKKRLERDNSGGWDHDYKKYIRNYDCDKIIELPIHSESRALSRRKYHFPKGLIHNINDYYLLDSGGLPKNISDDVTHPMYALYQVMSIFEDVSVGFQVDLGGYRRDSEGLNPKEREFDLTFWPIAFRYRRFKRAYGQGSIHHDPETPMLVKFREHGVHHQHQSFSELQTIILILIQKHPGQNATMSDYVVMVYGKQGLCLIGQKNQATVEIVLG